MASRGNRGKTSKRSISDGYKKRLKEYVWYRVAQVGTRRAFSRVLGVHHSTLAHWLEGRLTEEIDPETLRKLARDRLESPAQTLAWLEGIDEGSTPILRQLRQIPLEELAKVLAIARPTECSKLFAIVSDLIATDVPVEPKLPKVSLENNAMCSPVGRVILSEIQAAITRGDFPDFSSAFSRFCELCQFLYPDRDLPVVTGLLDGRVLIAGDDVIGAIAIALEELSGNSQYTFYYLRSIQTETPAPDWDRGCERAVSR